MNAAAKSTRVLVALYTASLVLCGCATSGGSADGTPAKSVLASHTDYKAAWNRHDVNAIVAYFGPNGTLSNPNAGPHPVSGQGLAAWLGALFTAVPDFRVDAVDNLLDDHTVAEQWVISASARPTLT